MRKLITKIIILLTVIMLLTCNISIADVGSFETYDSGSSSWGDSSWGSSSTTGDYGVYFFGGDIWGIGLFLLILIIGAIAKSNRGSRNTYIQKTTNPNIKQNKSETQIENEIKAHDELFNKEEIIAWSKTLFVKLQQSWTKREWSEIRKFETNQLFEQHRAQLQGYIDNNQINVMDRICINYANLYNYRISGEKEFLTIKLDSRMKDYIIDATTKRVLRGDPNVERTNSYLLTFERKLGVQTKPGKIEVNTTNCPNCGAPTQITSSGKCEYCGSIVTTGEYNWCLSNLERA